MLVSFVPGIETTVFEKPNKYRPVNSKQKKSTSQRLLQSIHQLIVIIAARYVQKEVENFVK